MRNNNNNNNNNNKEEEEETRDDDEKEKVVMDDEALVLPVYIRMWAVSTFLRVVTRFALELVYNPAVAVAACVAFCLPQTPLAVLVGLGVRIFALIASLPHIHNSQHWCLQTDIAMFVAVLAVLVKRRGVMTRRLGASAFTRTEALEIAKTASATIRIQLICFYGSAALLKLNTAFLDSRFSCATIYMTALLEHHVPSSVLASMPSLPALVYATAPALVFLVEAVIPPMLIWTPRSGLAFTALFHWAIAVTPRPNNIASFGVSTMPRLLLLVPEHAAIVRTARTMLQPGWTAASCIGLIALTMAMQPTWRIDASVPICAAMVAIVAIASIVSSSPPKRQTESVAAKPSSIGWLLRIVAFVYAFLAVPSGMFEVGNASPFSCLRKHGGTNNWILPTGIVQELFADETPESIMGEAFGGGIVRIEATNASHLTGPLGLQFPGLLSGHTPGTVELLQRGGHSGKQWSPNGYASAVGNRPPGKPKIFQHGASSSGAPFAPYTVQAAEMRRLIRHSRSRYPLDEFDIAGAMLPGVEGDEMWRMSAVKTRFLIRRRFDASGNELLTCTDPVTEDDCDEWTRAVLLTPPTNRLIAMLFRKILLQMPVVITPEMAGPHRLIHCTGE